MRGALTALAAMAWIASASAQDAMPENGLGPYHFAMSFADTEATSPHTSWRVEEAAGFGTVLSGGPPVDLGDAGRFRTSLVFEQNLLRWIILSGSAPTDCAATAPALIAHLEPIFGAFHAAPGPRETEEGAATTVSMTAGGSEIRIYHDPHGRDSAFSSRRGGMFIQLIGEPPPGDAHGCKISLVFNEQAPDDGASVTNEELDRAQTLEHPVWARRPTGQSFVRFFPQHALLSGTSGRTQLNCLINPDGSLRCRLSSESPANFGFGAAALAIARDFRAQLDPGVVGKRVHIPITFRVG